MNREEFMLEVRKLLGKKVLVNFIDYDIVNELATVVGYSTANNIDRKDLSIAIEFEKDNIGNHNCTSSSFILIYNLKKDNGLYVSLDNIMLLTEKPHIGKRHSTKLII